MGELAKQPNLGPVLEAQLARVGIHTLAQLREAGSREAWLRIQALDESACLHRLLAMEGAIRGVKKTQLPDETRAELRAFVQAHRKGGGR